MPFNYHYYVCFFTFITCFVIITLSNSFINKTEQKKLYVQTTKYNWNRIRIEEMKWNESDFRPPLCTYRLNWARRTSWGWWDYEMTLSSRHRIRNSSPGGLMPSTLPLGHGGSPQYWLSHVDGEETFLFLSNRRDREPNPELWRERQRC